MLILKAFYIIKSSPAPASQRGALKANAFTVSLASHELDEGKSSPPIINLWFDKSHANNKLKYRF